MNATEFAKKQNARNVCYEMLAYDNQSDQRNSITMTTPSGPNVVMLTYLR